MPTRSDMQAAEVVRAVFDALDIVKQFPRSGREVPELEDPDIREVIVFSYRVLYHLHEDDTVIKLVAVLHGARDLKRALGRRPT